MSCLSERKLRMRRFRAIVVLTLALVILSAPLASAAQVRQVNPKAVSTRANPGLLLSSFGDLLAFLWQKAGCHIDPLGTKEGCRIDPLGSNAGAWIDPLGTKAGAHMDPLGDPQPENLDEGCGMDPLGGCRSGS